MSPQFCLTSHLSHQRNIHKANEVSFDDAKVVYANALVAQVLKIHLHTAIKLTRHGTHPSAISLEPLFVRVLPKLYRCKLTFHLGSICASREAINLSTVAHVPPQNNSLVTQGRRGGSAASNAPRLPLSRSRIPCRAAGREVNQASGDIPPCLRPGCLRSVTEPLVRGQQTDGSSHTSGCQECQVAAVWRRIFPAAPRSAQTPQMREFSRRAAERRMDGAPPRPQIEGFKCRADATEELFLFPRQTPAGLNIFKACLIIQPKLQP